MSLTAIILVMSSVLNIGAEDGAGIENGIRKEAIPMNNETDFHINVKPVSIDLTCPHCGMEIDIPWKQVCEPDYWGDDWGRVECYMCGKEIKLGDYEYD